MSEYTRKLEAEESKKFNREQSRRSMQNLYDQYSGDITAIEKEYVITTEEMQMLKEIQEEENHQKELDQAFLKGFTGN